MTILVLVTWHRDAEYVKRTNKKVICKFKKLDGVRLRTKLYSLLYGKDQSKKTAKRVKRVVMETTSILYSH